MLVTRAQDFMGPAITEVFSEEGADVMTDSALAQHVDTACCSVSAPTFAEVVAEYLHDFTGYDLDRIELAFAAYPAPSVWLLLGAKR